MCVLRTACVRHEYLVRDVAVAAVAPHRQVGVAQHHPVLRRDAVKQHVLLHKPTAEHLRQDEYVNINMYYILY